MLGYAWAGGKKTPDQFFKTISKTPVKAGAVTAKTVVLTPYQIQTMKRHGCKMPEGFFKVSTNKPANQHIIDHHLWQVWRDFQNLCGQWRYKPMGFGSGIRVDLDTSAVISHLKLRYATRKQVNKAYHRIRYIIKGVMAADHEIQKKKKKK